MLYGTSLCGCYVNMATHCNPIVNKGVILVHNLTPLYPRTHTHCAVSCNTRTPTEGGVRGCLGGRIPPTVPLPFWDTKRATTGRWFMLSIWDTKGAPPRRGVGSRGKALGLPWWVLSLVNG